ncbi:sulfatase [Myxococcota bacterium]|nr:sulfatase [Myxococcota bacterium]
MRPPSSSCLAACLTLLGVSCDDAPPAASGPTIVLITLDTTRADAIGAWGGPSGATPQLDALAARGARFAWAFAHAPTTLSSHASIFTGLDPHGHAVPRNGVPLFESHVTVAERLAAHGFETLAVLGSSALDRSTGILQGFSAVDDRLSVDQGRRYEDTAPNVTARALGLVDRREGGRPLFLWVHYFDAHSPYAPPEALAQRFVPPGVTPTAPMEGDDHHEGFGERVRQGQASAEEMLYWRGMYQAEVSYADAGMGALLDGLRARGLLDDAWVIVAADHGEMFYEVTDRPMGHGPDIDPPLTHVPVVITREGPGAPAPRDVREPVALSDLGPTLLSLAGHPEPLGEGRDLVPATRGEALAPRALFLEATRVPSLPRDGSWDNLQAERGVVWQDQMMTRTPWLPTEGPTFARLTPEGVVVTKDNAAALGLTGMLNAWDGRAPAGRAQEAPHGPMREALKALGYLEE